MSRVKVLTPVYVVEMKHELFHITLNSISTFVSLDYDEALKKFKSENLVRPSDSVWVKLELTCRKLNKTYLNKNWYDSFKPCRTNEEGLLCSKFMVKGECDSTFTYHYIENMNKFKKISVLNVSV